jgi:hypothetical protein
VTQPSVFIVGAAKCGTSAMYRYLGAHPGVFAPELKEPHHFDTDLLMPDAVRDRPTYEQLYSARAPAQIAIDATVGYMYSRVAARAIHAFNSDARVLVLLRNPVDFIHALHQHQIWAGTEPLRDLREALAAEPARIRGEHIPWGRGFRAGLFYRDRARFAGQVERVVDAFGSGRVRVILQEDLRRSPADTYADTLRFLGLDDSHRPSFAPVNERRTVRSVPVHRLAMALTRSRIYPLLRQPLRRLYLTTNVPDVHLRMDPEVRKVLQDEFGPEIDRLARVIGRDLSAWHRGGEAPYASSVTTRSSDRP